MNPPLVVSEPCARHYMEVAVSLDKPMDFDFVKINQASVQVSIHSARKDDLERFGYVSAAVGKKKKAVQA